MSKVNSTDVENVIRHTPGPWSHMEINHSNREASIDIVRDVEGEPVAHICTMNDDLINEESLANTLLIAAAPDMLAALVAAERTLSVATIGGKSLYGADVTTHIRTVIAKAEGR